MLPYCPDAPQDPPELQTSPPIAGMLETADRLERELSALRDEREEFQAFAETARALPLNLKSAVLEEYDNKIDNRAQELADVKAFLAGLGYAA